MSVATKRVNAAIEAINVRELLDFETDDRRDADAEEVLNRYGVSWTYRMVDIADIDMKESELNRGRLERLNDETTAQYAERMKAGDRFPAGCYRQLTSGKYVVAGGMHRLNGKIMNGVTVTLALVFQTDDHTFRLICRRLNAVMGQRTTTSERVAQAADLVTTGRMQVNEAAAEMCVARSSVSNYINRMHVMARLIGDGISAVDVEKLNANKFSALNRLDNIPNVMTEMARLAIRKPKMTADDLRATIDTVLELPDEKTRLNYVRQEISQCKQKAPRSVSRPNRMAMIHAIEKLERLMKKCKTTQQLQLDASEVPELKKRCQELCQQITTTLNG